MTKSGSGRTEEPPAPQLEVYDSTTVSRAGGPPAARTPPPAKSVPSPRGGHITTEVLSNQDDGTTAKEQAERAPADWAHFSPLPERPVDRRVRIATAAARVLVHEWSLVILAGLALALALNWRTLADPRHALPGGLADPSLYAYVTAWIGHALGHDASNLWHLNGFFPAPLALAYHDPMLGWAPLGLVGTGPEAAVLRYNLMLVAGHALAFIGPYALARQLGLARVGAALVGVALAVAPWRLGEAGHLHVLAAGAAVLALAMLARAHGVRWRGEPARPRPEWALAGWLLLAWQLLTGFGIGVVATYLVAAAFVAGLVRWAIRRRGRPSRWLVTADALGVVVLAGAFVFVTRAQQRVLDLYPEADRIDAHSPSVRGLFTAPAGSLLWGGAHGSSRARLDVPGEMALLPGFALYALALAGLVFSVWTVWVRLALFASAVLTTLLALGVHGPFDAYVWVAGHLPGLPAERAPGRLILWTTLLLALLAAGGLGALVERAREVALRNGSPAPTAEAMAALLLPIALVLVEGLGVPAARPVPPAPAALATVRAPYLVLPSDADGDGDVLLWSTDRFGDVVNGAGPFVPTELAATRERMDTFPDAESVDYLRKLGVRTVVLLPDRLRGTPWEGAAEAPVESLGVTRQVDPQAVVFQLG
jgi:hypothetical protein